MNIKPMVAVDVLAERIAQLEEYAFAGGSLPEEEAPGSPTDEALIVLRALVRQANAVVDDTVFGGDWEIAIDRIGALLNGTATNLEPEASLPRAETTLSSVRTTLPLVGTTPVANGGEDEPEAE